MRISSVIGQARTYIGNEKGSFAVISAAIMAVLAMSAGFAINLAQLHGVRSNLGQALDAAVTSTARTRRRSGRWPNTSACQCRSLALPSAEMPRHVVFAVGQPKACNQFVGPLTRIGHRTGQCRG